MPFISSFRNTTRTNQRVAQGLTNVRPAPNAITLKSNYPSIGDGAYYIRVNAASTSSNAIYCDMTNAGGGWMLAAKIDTSSNSEWNQQSTWWNTSSDVNIGNMSSLAANDGVSEAYYNYTLQTGVRMCASNINNALQYNITGITPKATVTAGRGTGFGRTAWINWIGGGSHQVNCNREGFNNSQGQFGIGFNNEGDCNTNDSGITVGGAGASGTGTSNKQVYVMVR